MKRTIFLATIFFTFLSSSGQLNAQIQLLADTLLSGTDTAQKVSLPGGSDRLLMLYISAEYDDLINTTDVYYGTKPMQRIAQQNIDNGTLSNEMSLYIMPEDSLALLGTFNINIELNGSESDVRSLHSGLVFLSDVDQAQPVTASNGNAQNANSISSGGSGLSVNPGDFVFGAVASSSSSAEFSADSGYTELMDTQSVHHAFSLQYREFNAVETTDPEFNRTNGGSSRLAYISAAVAASPSLLEAKPVPELNHLSYEAEAIRLLMQSVACGQNANLVLEQSADGLNWTDIHARSFEKEIEIELDIAVESGETGFFRLRLECNSANPSYSALLAYEVPASAQPADFAVYPNPADNEFCIESDKGMENATIVLFDWNGKIIYNERPASAQKRSCIATEHLPNGAYFLLIRNSKASQSRRIDILH